MIISKTVPMFWNIKTKQHYIDKGYKFTAIKNRILVNVEDLTRGSNIKVIAKCDICGNEEEVIYFAYVKITERHSKYLCSKCGHKHRKGFATFEEKVYKLYGDEYSVIGKYENSETKILIKHNTCGSTFDIHPNRFLHRENCSCPMCNVDGQFRMNTNIKIEEKYKNKFEILTPYTHSLNKISIKCLVCDAEYNVIASQLYPREYRCKHCVHDDTINRQAKAKVEKRKLSTARAKIFRTTESVKKEIKELTSGEYELVGEYKNCAEKIKIKHNACGDIYDIEIHSFVNKGSRCYKCFIAEKCKEFGIPVEQWGKSSRDDRWKMCNWGNKVKKRDNCKCVICGSHENLNAHHLNGHNWDVANRSNVKNGVTLCESCHSGFHDIYGWGGNTKEQFKEFEKPKQLALII